MPSIINATTTNGVAISPDNSGSLQLATNNGTTAVTIDTSQNVLIGTTTARSELTVAYGDATGNGITLVNTSTGNNTTKYSSVDYSGTDTGGTYKTTGYARMLPENANYINSALAFATRRDDTVTERMRIDSSGNVGIGSTSPNIGGLTRALTINTPTGGNYSGIELAGAGTLSARFITNNAAGTYFGSQVSVPLIFETNATERMRITSGGDTVVGGTVACNSSSGRGNITINGTSNSILNFTNNNNSSEGGYLYFNGTDMVFSSSRASSKISVVSQTNGVVLNNGATSWSSLSDERVKDIIEPITDGLSKVASIRPVIGKYKTDAEGTRRSFLIAQDVQAVLPEAVVAQNDEIGTLTLSYTDTIPLLVKAIQELKAELDATKAEVQALKGVA